MALDNRGNDLPAAGDTLVITGFGNNGVPLWEVVR
jgi:hypothetical protein